jgi:hypothetical protein
LPKAGSGVGFVLNTIVLETIGWLSTALFLLSIVVPRRVHLHMLGIVTAVTTGIYAYAHGATAIWVKWVIACGFHAWMWYRTARDAKRDG